MPKLNSRGDVSAIETLRDLARAISTEQRFYIWRDNIAQAGRDLAAIDYALQCIAAVDVLKLAQPEFCSMRCPSIFNGPDGVRHIPECDEMRAAIAKVVTDA